MLDTEMDVKFWCTQTVGDMLMNQSRLFYGGTKRLIRQLVMDTTNKRIYDVMKKLQKVYFTDKVTSER